ncbi:hypothetical protein HOD38_05365 [archaeon]|jgi:hypothetical protein|nr:hypothetical protein [archaeon]MBT4397669.1 hypothetical protein [archaeon]MBT4441635.1 hypothetical protein [archaeon]
MKKGFIYGGAGVLAIVAVVIALAGGELECDDNGDGIVDAEELEICSPGYIVTQINTEENGKIAVRIDIPDELRYGDEAPIVVVASTWFVEKYNDEQSEFHLIYNPVDVGAVSVTNLWPGKYDKNTGVVSEGEYDFGGEDSLAALRDTIRFSLGEIPDVNGKYLHELIEVDVLYDNVGMFASSHAGVVATNVMAYYGEDLQSLKYFVGRENPTMAEMYPLEIGHFDEVKNKVYNPYYDYKGYTSTSIDVDYSEVTWVEQEEGGRPAFGDYVLDYKGPQIDGKSYFSQALTHALYDNEAFDEWPDNIATVEEVDEFWPYRITVNNYDKIGEKLPELKVLLPFAAADHVQAADDKPHIRQAYDGFHKTAGLWTRLNCDISYVQSEIHSSADENFPDNDANNEPDSWYLEIEDWGFPDKLNNELTARTVPLAGVAEMADRVYYDNWDDNLDEVLQ